GGAWTSSTAQSASPVRAAASTFAPRGAARTWAHFALSFSPHRALPTLSSCRPARTPRPFRRMITFLTMPHGGLLITNTLGTGNEAGPALGRRPRLPGDLNLKLQPESEPVEQAREKIGRGERI